MPKHCSACGTKLTPGAKFCHRCGASVTGDGAPGGGGATPAAGGQQLPWAVAGIALLSLLAFIVGQNWRRGAASAPPAANVAQDGARAVDISQMTPNERAERLFDRVMRYVSAGHSDSVAFFAPMAIASFEALAPLDPHRRYDLGLLGVVSGDGALARAHADSILAAEPRHLLGLILGMRAAGVQLDTAARAAYARRFEAALTDERAKRLPEYVDHQADIDAAVRDLDARRPPSSSPDA